MRADDQRHSEATIIPRLALYFTLTLTLTLTLLTLTSTLNETPTLTLTLTLNGGKHDPSTLGAITAVCFSGGGVRSAAFVTGVMESLAAVGSIQG